MQGQSALIAQVRDQLKGVALLRHDLAKFEEELQSHLHRAQRMPPAQDRERQFMAGVADLNSKLEATSRRTMGQLASLKDELQTLKSRADQLEQKEKQAAQDRLLSARLLQEIQRQQQWQRARLDQQSRVLEDIARRVSLLE